ncbi:MAG: CAP domain-containing protein [Methanobacteriota archaeon]
MDCDHCGRDIDGMPFTCNRCGETHCSDHRLPEYHECVQVQNTERSWENYASAQAEERPSGSNNSLSGVADVFWLLISIPYWIGSNMIGFLKFTRKYPATGLWKISKFAIVAAVLVLIAGQAGFGPIDSPQEQVVSPFSSTVSNVTESTEINETQVEQLVSEEVNQRRSERGLSQLSESASLNEQSRLHSDDMAAHDDLAHDLPGSTTDERLSRASCPTGGENVAQSWVFEDIETESGTEYLTDEEELANSLTRQWMNSPGHRENILRTQWSETGVGITITDENKVYATQMFCA